MTSTPPAPRSPPHAAIAAVGGGQTPLRWTRRPRAKGYGRPFSERPSAPTPRHPQLLPDDPPKADRPAATTGPSELGPPVAAKPQPPSWPHARRSESRVPTDRTAHPEGHPVGNPPSLAGARKGNPDYPKPHCKQRGLAQPEPTRFALVPARHERTAEEVDRYDASRLPNEERSAGDQLAPGMRHLPGVSCLPAK